MPRKGKVSEKTKMIVNNNIANPAKKVKHHTGSKEKIAEVLQAERKNHTKHRNPLPLHVIPLEYPFFIRTYSAGFALCIAKKAMNGKPTYESLCYSSRLANMFEIAVNHMIKVPLDVQELSEKLDHIYNMIKARVENKKVTELFSEYKDTQEFLEDFAK